MKSLLFQSLSLLGLLAGIITDSISAFTPQSRNALGRKSRSITAARLHVPSPYHTTPRRIPPLFVTDDVSIQTTSLQRMRKRKVKILKTRKLKSTSILFALWYVLSIGYNLFSKKALNMAPSLAWTTAALQMAGGLCYVLPLWAFKLRPTPQLSAKDIQKLSPVSLMHSLVHIGGVVSMGAGAVSFTYIVKASEPAVSALLLALTGTFLPFVVNITLLPVMAGVAIASVNELSFTWKSFNYAMMSNLASASRAIVGKKTINSRLGHNLSPLNLYAVLTIMSTCCLLPLAGLTEGPVLLSSFRALKSAGQLLSWTVYTFLASIFYYTYNEVAFLCLDNVSPVSHAIANTLKRVFIIVSSMLVFGNKMTLRGIAGSTLAIGGVLWYSLEKSKYKARLKAEKDDKNRKAKEERRLVVTEEEEEDLEDEEII